VLNSFDNNGNSLGPATLFSDDSARVPSEGTAEIPVHLKLLLRVCDLKGRLLLAIVEGHMENNTKLITSTDGRSRERLRRNTRSQWAP
jgi:hypothetical protein